MVSIAQFPYLQLFGLGGLGVSALCHTLPVIHHGSSPLGTAGSRSSSQVLVSLVICVFSLFFLQISTDYLILEQENIAEDAVEKKMWNAKWGGGKKHMENSRNDPKDHLDLAKNKLQSGRKRVGLFTAWLDYWSQLDHR